MRAQRWETIGGAIILGALAAAVALFALWIVANGGIQRPTHGYPNNCAAAPCEFDGDVPGMGR